MVSRKAKIVFLIAAAELVCSFAYSQEIKDANDRWRLKVTPYVWFLNVDGKIEINGHKGTAHVNSTEIYDALDVGGMANIELRKEKWGLFVNPIYMKLNESSDLTILLPDTKGIPITDNTKIGITATVIEFGGFYQIGQWCPSGDKERAIKLDAIAGGRYWDIEQRLSFGSLKGKVQEDWVDPFVGARLRSPINDWLLINMIGDVGGFSISEEASNNTYNLYAGAEIKLTKNIDLMGGYRWFKFERAKSSDTNSNISFSGPLVGLQIRF